VGPIPAHPASVLAMQRQTVRLVCSVYDLHRESRRKALTKCLRLAETEPEAVCAGDDC
jgi:hypothetical protein